MNQSTPRLNPNGYPQRRPLQSLNEQYPLQQDDRRYGAIAKPKVITVVRAGRKPYANIKILLNRRSVQSYERLLSDISESFGPKWKNNKVRSLYTLTGKQVLSISDFFRGDSIFIAVGSEKISFTDVQEIIESLYPNSPYAKSLLRNIEKQKKKTKQQMLQSLANDNQDIAERSDVQKPPKRAVIKHYDASAQKLDSDPEEAPKKRTRPPKATKLQSPQEHSNKENKKQGEYIPPMQQACDTKQFIKTHIHGTADTDERDGDATKPAKAAIAEEPEEIKSHLIKVRKPTAL